MELITQLLLVAVEMLVSMVQTHLYQVQELQQLLQLVVVKVEPALLLILLRTEAVAVAMAMEVKMLVRQERLIKVTLAEMVQAQMAVHQEAVVVLVR